MSKTVDLALQGGGAHGAFTWGALDRLLEEERVEIEGISATSAGAMNAAALKTGLVGGGSREAARETLDRLWGAIAPGGAVIGEGPLMEWVRAAHPPLDALVAAMEASPAYHAAEALTRALSPYQLNPFDFNPLRHLLDSVLDFDAVCRKCAPYLFVCATNVRTGKARVFSGDEIATDVLLASACLPTLFQAVEIDDPATGRREAFWDGGYSGNPALFPLFYETATRDVIIVHVNPIVRDEVPRSARDILDRINEISFNASLLRELRAVDFVRRLIAEGRIERGRMKDVLIHSVADDATMTRLSAATKAQPTWGLLRALKDAGRAAMDRFLRDHWADLGARPSVDLRAVYG